MQERYAIELLNGVVEMAQQGMGCGKLLAEMKEVQELNRIAFKREIAMQNFVETVRNSKAE